MTANEIPLNSRVSLRGGFEAVYDQALAGSEGYVRIAQTDDDGFDRVFIEWDKAHWRFSGEPDGWTFASHFRVIGPPELPSAPEADEIEDTNLLDPIELDEADLGVTVATDEEWQRYFQTLNTGSEKAADSNNFVLVTFAEPDDGGEVVPHIYMSAMDPEMSWRLYAQLGKLGTAALVTLTENKVRALREAQ